jgi:hypothetical protein
MKRAALSLAAIAAVATIPLTAGIALAAPPSSTTVTTTFTLACDHGVGASVVTVSLTDALGNPDGGATLACGPDSLFGAKRIRAELTTSVAPTDAHIGAWSWNVGSGSGTCSPPDGALPYKASCGDANGTGATLTIR